MTDKLKALALAATKGPWTFTRHTGDIDGTHSASDDWTVNGSSGSAICFEGSSPALADPEFIAAASPDVVLGLIEDLEKHRALLLKHIAVIDPLKAELDLQKSLNELAVSQVETLVKHNGKLRARIAELEGQEPVLWAAKESMSMWGKSDESGHPYHVITKGQKVRSHQIPLYLTSGAVPAQEPVAWIEHQWSGSGQKLLHFERPTPTIRDEVVNPIWAPLFLASGAAPETTCEHHYLVSPSYGGKLCSKCGKPEKHK